MVKGSEKSSASSSTRKKHAQKHQQLEKKPKNKEKGKKSKEPRLKVYIPPVKPTSSQPDPLETTGLAHRLPADLLVVLRSLAKKATVTKGRALEDLQTKWVLRAVDDDVVYVLVDLLPVWVHHLPSLLLHPSRRIRLLTVSLHNSLLQIYDVRAQMLLFLRDASSDQMDRILGSWCITVYDIDRLVASSASSSWSKFISLAEESENMFKMDESAFDHVVSFVQRAVLDPGDIYEVLNPPPPLITQPTAYAKRQPRVDAPVERTKADDSDESDEDRDSRIRIGALGALRWILDSPHSTSNISISLLLSNPALWSSLHHSKNCDYLDDIQPFGFGQPLVRRSAWMLLQTVLQLWKDRLEVALPVISTAVLRSAWVEPDAAVRSTMWEPLLFFLKRYPQAWELDMASADGHSEDEDEELKIQPRTSQAYREFLQFLEMGCSGSPLQCYPAVVVILSTIPPSIFKLSSTSGTPLDMFFISFWAAVDGRALKSLNHLTASAAFLSSLLECFVFLVRRIVRDTTSMQMKMMIGKETQLKTVIGIQFERLWTEISSTKALKVDYAVAGKIIVENFMAFESIENELAAAAWTVLANHIRAPESEPHLVATLLNSFKATLPSESPLATSVDVVMKYTLHECIQECAQLSESPSSRVSLLEEMFGMLGSTIFDDKEFTLTFDELLSHSSYQFLILAPSILFAYILNRKDEGRCLRVWQLLLQETAAHPEDIDVSLARLLDAIANRSLPDYLLPCDNYMDTVLQDMMAKVLGGSSMSSSIHTLLRRVLEAPMYFLSSASFQSIMLSIVKTFTFQVQAILKDVKITPSSFEGCMDILVNVFKFSGYSAVTNDTELVAELIPNVFVLGYLVPSFESDHAIFSQARSLWIQWSSSQYKSEYVLSAIRNELKTFVEDVEIRTFPEDVLKALSDSALNREIAPFSLIPSKSALAEMLAELSPNPIDPTLAILDSIIPPESTFSEAYYFPQPFDSRGHSSYSRLIQMMVSIFMEDRQAAKDNAWVLRHLLSCAIYVEDLLNVPFGSSSVFSNTALNFGLASFHTQLQQLATYLLTSTQSDQSRLEVLDILVGKKSVDNLSAFSESFVDLYFTALKDDNIRDCRVLQWFLRHAVVDAEKDEVDKWMLLARQTETSAPLTSISIYSSVALAAPNSQRLDRYRNEMAASLLKISPADAITDGLRTLQILLSCAPDAESDVVFMPQLRAVNTVKACQRWVTSDEDDVNEDVESAMTLLFDYLAPILQSISGAHWDFIFDLIENNLENADFTQDDGLVVVARTLKLIITIETLSSTNKTLRTDWDQRRMSVFTGVRDMAAIKIGPSKNSVPHSVCREYVLSIVKDLPTNLIEIDTLPKTCHLLSDSSIVVQQMAYQLMEQAARRRTEYLVIEAGVSTDDTFKAELPLQLFEILQQTIVLDEGDWFHQEQLVFGYLLSWMTTFDLFVNSSLKVRLSYIDQLRSLGIFGEYFMPNILSILRLNEGINKAFKLDVWAVDEYYVQLYEKGASFSLEALAAHVYYRALLTVPSIIYGWVLDCKDRQISAAITNYTAVHFSPVIIQRELMGVKSPQTVVELADENLSVKVASSIDEVIASYTVDEHQLEIRLKIPSDWPFNRMAVKGTKQVIVEEKRWRAWILAIQQTIWSQNGHILDAIELFKKNVALFFEGQTECAICYSIVSVMDSSLPKTPCKTCKNRFHAGCLYKWFNTSHSSSCPLCRSDMF